MPAISSAGVADIIDRRRRERETGGERYVDMRIDFELDGNILLSVGGRWDRRANDYDGEAETGVVVRIHAGQRRAVEWFAAWLEEHRGRRDSPPPVPPNLDEFELDTDPAHVYSALFAGGRRAGKTWIATAFAVAYALAFPHAIVWLASPSDQKHDEFRRYAIGNLAPVWVDRETAADGWELCNGSRLILKSGYDAEGLKEGEAHLIVLNEAQQMKQRAFTVARGCIVDRAGCVIVCANPPVEAGDQQWVADFAAEAAAGRRAAVFIEFNPLQNPHIDRASLLSMSAELDERTYAIEVLGQFRGPADAVAHNWIRLENERRVPEKIPDCTTDFLSSIGEGIGITDVVGLDVQRFPYIGGPVYRFFGLADRDHVLAWIIDEVILEGGDEVDFCDALRGKGYKPHSTLIVCDASGRYQHSRRRSTDQPPPDWKGRGSFDIIKSEGFRRIVPPDRRMKRNPEIVDRARAFTSMIATRAGRRRLFADPDRAPQTCKAIREWKQVHGTPSRSQQVAHVGDGASYVIVRLFPRRLRSGKPGGVDPVAQKLDLAPPIPAESSELRIMPPQRGPSGGPRRGDRFRGY